MGFGVCAVSVLLVELDGIGRLASCVERSEHIFNIRYRVVITGRIVELISTAALGV